MPHSPEEDSQTMRVRPYLLTGGRTRSAVDLPIEALVLTSPAGLSQIEELSHERRLIVQLCAERQSLAEISAHTRTHLQVAKVLVGDLITEGLLTSLSGATATNSRPDVQLLERVLDGLQSL